MDSYGTKILCNLGTPSTKYRPSVLILSRPVSQLSVDTPADSVDMSVDISLPGVGLHEELADTSTKVSVDSTGHTLVPEVFLDFSLRKRSTASREAVTTSRVSDEEREKNLWLPWPRISLSCRRQLSNASNC